MEDASRQAHWENVYTTKGENEVSWFQQSPAPSLELIVQAGAVSNRRSSTLAAALRGWSTISLSRGLRMSPCSICRARHWRLPGLASRARADRVHWLVADATTFEPVKPYDIWHDRAAFHFLTDAKDRAAYIERLRRGLKIGGHAIIATFALDGPENAVACRSPAMTARASDRRSAPRFKLVHTQRHEHATPWDSRQIFQFSVFRREG